MIFLVVESHLPVFPENALQQRTLLNRNHHLPNSHQNYFIGLSSDLLCLVALYLVLYLFLVCLLVCSLIFSSPFFNETASANDVT